MVKVLHINDDPPYSGGGAEVMMSRTIALLRARDITIATFTGADLADSARTPLRYIDNRHTRQALAAKLAEFRPDIVHLHNFYHLLSPAVLAVLEQYKRHEPLRVVMTAHDYHLACPNSGGSWFRRWSGRREAIDSSQPSLGTLLWRTWDHRSPLHSLLRIVQYGWNYRWHHRQRVIDLVLCPSRFVQKVLTPIGVATSWLPHPVSPLPAVTPNRAGPLHFVFAGRIEPEKGLNELLQQWPTDFPAALTIVGDGAQMARCRATCAARKWMGPVEFIGRLSHTETLARIARCHVLVQPSRVLETYGLALIEALSCGTNILAGRRGAACEIVEDTGVGYLYDLDDAKSLATQLHAIGKSFAADTLNRFEITSFLEGRSESIYVDALLRSYGCAAPALV